MNDGFEQRGNSNERVQPDELEEEMYDFKRPGQGINQHHMLPPPEPPSPELQSPRPGVTSGDPARQQDITNEQNNFPDALVARLAKGTHTKRIEMMDLIHPMILAMILKRARYKAEHGIGATPGSPAPAATNSSAVTITSPQQGQGH